ncbi:beta strand repeat-containing protein, partial [Trabulsiella odontotermitis]
GGTGTKVDGDGAEVNNNGSTTVDGDGSTGTAVTGDDAVVNNGDTAATGGGTGTKVDGDNAQINNNGNATVDGSGSTGTAITGDGAVVNNGGDATISGGGTGTRVDGNDAVIVNTGDTTADGEGSAGTVINGDNASFDQQGDITVTNGATGIAVNGATAKIDNSGTITVTDAGSVGVSVSGDNATFINSGTIDSSLNGTGVSITGDSASVTLDGTVNVHAEKNADGVYQGATGVSVAGNNSATEITGNVAISGSMATDEEATTTGKLDGINVSGNSNSVVLDGTLSMTLDSQNQPFSASGITVTGSDNDVQIKGGVTISSQGGVDHYATGIAVTGKNTVTVSGHSTLDVTGVNGSPTVFALVNEGGQVILTEDSILDTSSNTTTTLNYNPYSVLQSAGENSSIVNEGIINTNVGTALMRADQGASVSNSGTINAKPVDGNPMQTSMIRADGSGSAAANRDGGVINIESTLAPVYSYGNGAYPLKWYANTEYALMASNYASVQNDTGATINLNGAGLFGLGASKGTATNAGTINVDGFIPTLDGDGTITGKTFWQISESSPFAMSAGMIIGSTDADNGDATGLNTGTINVNNEGFGMLALNGGTVTNQGTINLTADEGVTASADNQLIGMGVMNGGTAINDESGTINIDADYGQAFYNDGTGTIFNYGAINLNGSPMDDSDAHMGDAPTDAVWLKNLTGSGDTDTRASDTGFAITDAMANYGSETLTGDVTSANWLYNEGNGSLTVNGGLTVITGLENSGTLQADTISASSSLYNRASGSMTTNTLSLSNSAIFFNEGDFTGSVIADSKDQYVVNTGDMTVAEDGKSLAGGTFRFFNQQGATLSNTGNAVEGGENSIINVTNTSTSNSLYQVNSGTITATNGYSAIKTANTSALGAWIWNTETGVINGVNPDAPLVDLGVGYNFSNAGTINVQGDNAVAISGGTGYTIKLVNSGTINVGTEEGKADGTNGTGLIGIKGNGTSTTINNTADGVINVYADDSYAFGGKTKAIINNGSINLLCDTGCGIYAPGTTYTTDSGEDIVAPTANTAPSQGTVPTPPADPNAPQVLTDYVIGTNADGSAGTLKASNLVIGDDVKVNTGFTSGTAATTVVLQDTFTGSNIQGADNITSTSVVWNAQGST